MLLVSIADGTGGSTKTEAKRIAQNELTCSAYCVQERFWNLDSVREFSGGGYFKIRYVYGVYDPIDRENELHMVIYSKDNKVAWLYEIYIERKGDLIECLIGNRAELRWEEKRWRVIETHGGVYSYARVGRLAKIIFETEELKIPYKDTRPPNCKCIPVT